MKFKIGFSAESHNTPQSTVAANHMSAVTPKPSVVQVRFPGRGGALAYYNDQFDLRVGNMVYVDGKLEGQRGIVTEVSYNFKIKASDYKRVIALVDTDVHGEFFMAGSHFISFDRNALPSVQAISWFKAPEKEDTEYLVGSGDDTSFRLDDLKGMKISPTIAERGHEYYTENKVRYICLDGNHGYAIVEGSEAYEVEFEFHDGEIRNLICSCFCSYTCKHEFAAMLQLRETLEVIGKHYAKQYEETGYFAAVHKGTLFAFAVDGKDTGSFTL